MTRDLYPSRHRRGQPGPGVVEVLDALARLHSACCLGHASREDGSRGRSEFEAAMTEARQVLQRSRKYGEVER